MKKNRMSFEDLSSELENTSGGKKNYDDDRMWYPKLDDEKNGYAVIRFLPTTKEDTPPFVKLYSHGFKGETGQWYFENCPTTLEDGECPVCTANRAIVESYGGWDDTPKSVKDGAIRNRKRKISYYSNIYVVSDPATPANEGKVFLFKYGQKIFDQLKEAANPSFPDKAPIQPFDMWEGANYKLKIRQVEKQTNYDSSEFEEKSQFLTTDDEMSAVYDKQHNLQEIIDPSEFKALADLEKRFNRVEGGAAEMKSAPVAESAPVETANNTPKFKDKTEDVPVAESVESNEDSASSEEEDAMKYFEDLAKT